MRIFFTFTIFCFCFNAIAQTDSTVNKIRQTVEQINKDTIYTTKTLDNEDFMEQMTDGGGHVTGYFKNGQLVKMVEFIVFSSCVNITEYYLKYGKLIFAYTLGKEFLYEDSIATFNSSIQNVTMECRFYFDNNKIIKQILKGQTRCSGKPTVDWSKDYLGNTIRYKKLIAKKNF